MPSSAAPLLFCQVSQVLEEAGLSPSQLRLVRCGRPLLVDDPPRHFCVHPFLLSMGSPEAAVQLNWENEGFAWHQPGDLRNLETVPLLAETYERVALGERQAAAVRRLAEDRSHGAAELAAWAVRALREEAAVLAEAAQQQKRGGSGMAAGAGPRCLAALRNLGWLLATCRPSMAAIASSVAAVLAAAHEELHARCAGHGGARAWTVLSQAIGTGHGTTHATVPKEAARLLPALPSGFGLSSRRPPAEAGSLLWPKRRADAFEAPAGEVCSIVQAAAAAEERRLEASAAELRRQVAALLRDGTTVLTTSLSSTILAALKEAAGRWSTRISESAAVQLCTRGARQARGVLLLWDVGDVPAGWCCCQTTCFDTDHMPHPCPGSPAEGGLKLRAIVCEARPLCEGVTLADAWAQAGIDVTLITDAQASSFVLLDACTRRWHAAMRAGAANSDPPPTTCRFAACPRSGCLPKAPAGRAVCAGS